MSRNKPNKLVAIVVPLHNRSELTPDEKISLKHLNHFLGEYDKYAIIPKSLEISLPGFKFKKFDNKFFGSPEANNQLDLSPKFYKSFNNYQFILLYHLDSLVFSNKLKEWCERNYDLIGAPWVKHPDAPYAGKEVEGKVGNIGFTLFKVESVLKVLSSKEQSQNPSEYWEKYYSKKSNTLKLLNYYKKVLKCFGFTNNVRWESKKLSYNSDAFFASRATHYYSEFNIPDVNTALEFAFEYAPRYCFEKNDSKLPFGCHAWARYDKSFWEPYVLK